jgi:hypothetical protein
MKENHNQSIGGASAFTNAAVIFQKIENTTHRVTSEISDNQRLTKDYQTQKRDIMRDIEYLK